MYHNILSLLKCPICDEKFSIDNVYQKQNDEIIDAHISCRNNHIFAIKDGVLDFNSQEQTDYNNWSKLYETTKQEEFDALIASKTPDNLKELCEKAIKNIINYLNQKKPNIIFDVATGRGSLLSILIKNLNFNPIIICTDLSYEVLKYDRIKFQNINPDLKINYIACDCSNIPITDKSIDLATSFFGISNMVDKANEGLKEVHRILLENSTFLDAAVTIEKNDNTLHYIEEVKKQFGDVPLEIISFNHTYIQLHKNIFKNVKDKCIGESIGKKNELDLIPIENEKFSIRIYQCTK